MIDDEHSTTLLRTTLRPGARRRAHPLVVAALAAAPLALVASTAHAQCAPGRVVTPETEGRCCWPGQRWSRQYGRCDGPPQCPAGYFASGNGCEADPNAAAAAPPPPAARAPSRSIARVPAQSVAQPIAQPVPPPIAPEPVAEPIAPQPAQPPPPPRTWSAPPGRTYYVWPRGVLTPPGYPLAPQVAANLPPEYLGAEMPARYAPPPAPTYAPPPAPTYAPPPAPTYAPPPAAPAPVSAQPSAAVAPAASSGSASVGVEPTAPPEPAPPAAQPPPAAPYSVATDEPLPTPPAATPRREEPYTGGPVPPGARVEQRVSVPLLATGATLFAVGHLTSLIVSVATPAYCAYQFSGVDTATRRANTTWTATGWIPFAGGIIAAASTACPASPTALSQWSQPGAGAIALVVVGSIAQLAGGTLFALGLRRHAVLVYGGASAARRAPRHRDGEVAAWSVAPIATSDTVGLAASITTF